ncbi:MAG: sugar diacid recognition domain-containing protein [Synergistota bacterium]|nr:sugar diacid recognition domain-containing protein [Synergistota bacterium]
MLQRFAQKICDTTHEIIGFHTLVTNEKAIIIGASELSRIGSVHHPSLEVMRTGNELFTDEGEALKFDGVKPGVTLPVSLTGNVVGSIAIAGDHLEVARYGYLVQKQAELFLREQMLRESSEARERALRDLVGDIASFKPGRDDASMLTARGRELGYDLDTPRGCLILLLGSPGDFAAETAEKTEDPLYSRERRNTSLEILRNIFPEPINIVADLGQRRFAVLSAVTRENETDWRSFIDERFRACTLLGLERSMLCTMGAGLPARTPAELHASYCAAWKALTIGIRKKRTGEAHYIEEYLVEDILTTVDVGAAREFTRRTLGPLSTVPDRGEMIRTFEAWLRDPCNPGLVAETLNIHRNTLHYRLEKIHRVTGLDPRKFTEAFNLHLALTLDMLHECTAATPSPSCSTCSRSKTGSSTSA